MFLRILPAKWMGRCAEQSSGRDELRSKHLFVLLAATFILATEALHAIAQAVQGPVFTFIEENDLVVDADRHYTQGIRLSYLHSDNVFPFGVTNVYSALPQISFQNEIGKFGYAIGQNIYTPGDVDTPERLPHDRPYAGWLYFGLVLQRRGVSCADHPTQEDFELDLGVIGPWALAKETQVWVHENSPRGWHHQLGNEPGLRLRYQRSVRFRGFTLDSFQGEALPHAGFSLGNVETSARLGATLRVGFHLPDDYGLQTIDSLATAGSGRRQDGLSPSRWSVYAFSGAEARVVAYNVFLDGNLFHQSGSVDKEIFVADFKAGLAVAYRALEIGYTQVWRTHEFRTQEEQDLFGAVFLRWRF